MPCYEAPYGSVSKSQDITSCTGPYLFVGTQIGDKQALEIGFMAVEYDDNSIESERPDFIISASLSREVTWSIDQSIGCSPDDELMTHSIVDTSSWTKHVHNCPGA